MTSKRLMKISVKYDMGGDVLYISIGDSKPAISEEIETGVLIRVDPVTQEFVGVTVLDFFSWFVDHGSWKIPANFNPPDCFLGLWDELKNNPKAVIWPHSRVV